MVGQMGVDWMMPILPSTSPGGIPGWLLGGFNGTSFLSSGLACSSGYGKRFPQFLPGMACLWIGS